MYKIVHINTFPNKATGSIMFSVHNELQKLDKWIVMSYGEEDAHQRIKSMNTTCNVDGK